MDILNGDKPIQDKVNVKNAPLVITEQELHDEDFISKHTQFLNMMKDPTKT